MLIGTCGCGAAVLVGATDWLAAGRRRLLLHYAERVELRQLRYFVTVADELNFGRAAQRLHIAGPSLSQQIKALERDLKVQLFDRDRRSVVLTPAGSALLPRARSLLADADDIRRHALGLSSSDPVRIGCVQWCPTDWQERAAGVAPLRVDTWVMPSHAQAARVADGSLDLAICWVQNADLRAWGLQARLVGVDRLYALNVGPDSSPVDGPATTVLVDSDESSWSSWNRFALQYARAVGAQVVRVDDGGVTGSTFHDHVRRLKTPLVNNPKGQNDTAPPDLTRRQIQHPMPLWTWSLVWRTDERNQLVHNVIDAFTADVDRAALGQQGVWLPDDDPHRAATG